MQVDVVVKSLFERSLCANSVQINVPVPPQTAKVNIKKSKGDAKYDGSLGVIRWNISKFSGQKQHTLSADVVLVSTTREKKTWNRYEENGAFGDDFACDTGQVYNVTAGHRFQ